LRNLSVGSGEYKERSKSG